jgi:hypothetical protein
VQKVGAMSIAHVTGASCVARACLLI